MSAAALELQDHDEILAARTRALLRQQAADVLAAHRSRRQRTSAERVQGVLSPDMVNDSVLPSRSQRIASRVTERYSQSQSYRAFLAAEADEATRKARAAAEVAARTANAVAEAQQKLLQELAEADGHAQEISFSEPAEHVAQETSQPIAPPSALLQRAEAPVQTAPITHDPKAGLSVRLYEDAGFGTLSATPQYPAAAVARWSSELVEVIDSEETEALDNEISFRQAPTFDVERASVSIPGNLLEFPRQLVAARKARPRYAEGPLIEESHPSGDEAQLRIFEVDAAQITSTPPIESSTPEWSSIWLDALMTEAPEQATEAIAQAASPVIEAASFERRIMAAIVDGCLVSFASVFVGSTFAYTAPVLPSIASAALFSIPVFAGFFLIYQALFFTLSDGTPGMRYARIGLCTFADENPTRIATLARVPATLLAACPLGLGFLWACLDDSRLGWHDRISGMYQRSY